MHKPALTATMLVVISCATIMLPGCASSPSILSSKRENATEIFERLQVSFPNGVAPEVAQKRMEEHGFECTLVTDGEFVHEIHRADPEPKKQTHRNIDFIQCNRKTQSGMWVTYFDDVALVIEDGVVVNVLSNWSAVGP